MNTTKWANKAPIWTNRWYTTCTTKTEQDRERLLSGYYTKGTHMETIKGHPDTVDQTVESFYNGMQNTYENFRVVNVTNTIVRSEMCLYITFTVD